MAATKNLGQIYTELAYVKGSLRNLGSGQGWTFTLANPPLPLAGLAEEMKLFVDGCPIAPDRVWIRTGHALRRMDTISRKATLTFGVGEGAVFRVEGQGLDPGEHRIEIVIKPLGFGEIYTKFGFADTVGEEDPCLTVREGFERPVALANGQAFAMANRAGDLSADWNWFGQMTDNGGLFLPPARFLRSLRFSAIRGQEERGLAQATVEARLLPGRLESVAQPFPDLVVERTVFVPRHLAAAVIRFAVRNQGDRPVGLELAADFEAALVPYGLLGVSLRSIESVVESGVLSCRTPELPYRVAMGASLAPSRVDLSGARGRLIYRLELAPGEALPLEFAVAGSVDGADPAPVVRRCLDEASALLVEAAGFFRQALAASYQVETPDPELNQAWTFARLALQHLCFRHPEIGAGICAGLPRFPNYWSRDSAWAAMGLLASGESAFVREVLANFFAHQLTEDRPEAQAGDLPTIISGPAFMHLLGWGTSADGPLLIAILLADYVQQSGDLAFGIQQFPALQKVLDWARRQDRDGDGYLEHGVPDGVSTSHAINIPDTTWMDHADRRKSGCEIQGLFWHALRRAADLAELLGHASEAAAWRAEAEALERRFWQDFFPEEAAYPYDRMKLDGTFDDSLRPNFVINLLWSTRLDRDRAARAFKALESDRICAPHGIRTLAEGHPKYDPIDYHNGCVWNLVTGWTAMAELAHGRVAEGCRLVRVLAENLLAEFGQASELYRGDRREAYNGCSLQAWSISVLLQAVGRYLLGLRPDGVAGELTVDPRLPAGWSHVNVRGVRVGDAVLDLTLRPDGIEATNRGTAPVRLRWKERRAEVAPGGSAALATAPVERR